MKLKLLLIVLLTSIGMVKAQDTIRSLVISEACMRTPQWAYLELTNMGDEELQLANFTVGKIEPWENELWTPRSPDRSFRLPERILAPGESFLIANVYDYHIEQHAKGVDTPGSPSAEVMNKKDLAEMADLQVQMSEESGEPTDSVSPYDATTDVWWGRSTWFLQYHLANGDSTVVDQVGGVFDSETGLNHPFDNRWEGQWGYNVAGVAGATFEAHLIRKFKVKQGNLDFAGARGVGNDDSEWIAIPIQGGPSFYNTGFRKALWTAGNHVNAQLNENTLESDVIDVDFANKSLTVPWGVKRNDYIMEHFAKKPGIGWNYHRAAGTSVEDSLSFAAKTGDQLELWVCGDEMNRAIFEIIVEEPSADAKIAIPKLNQDPEGNWRNNLGLGLLIWPRVTQHETDNDTIWGEWGGIPYQTRIDSLLDRLDIPSNAAWELVTVDGVERPDVKEGDLLKIIAENGSEKDYYIAVNANRASHNAFLSAITWPDIPDYYYDIFGWTGDTIPNFGSNTYNYTVMVPIDVEGIPALVAKSADLNSNIEVKRATSLSGTREDRTVTFTVTAEDDTTMNTYSVELIKELNPDDVQPFNPDPIISEYIWKNHWANCYMEIFNPGNQPIDLSDYMFVGEWGSDPVWALDYPSAPDGFGSRYKNYIPGYKYTNQNADWTADPGILEPDLNVNPVVLPGEVFVMADIRSDRSSIPYNVFDIEFNDNPWGASIGDQSNAINHWVGNMWVFKIINDSIKLGLKAPNDINDLELIDTYSMGPAEYRQSWRRLPGIWQGNPVLEDSQGDDDNKMEWEVFTPGDFDADADGVPSNIGQHFFIPPTHYMSTVSSVVYKVSDGYSMEESIRGMTTGTTVADFMANLIMKDEDQTLNIHSVENGSVLAMDEALSMNDTLVVMSADSVNFTKYILEVSEEGLSSNAVLTSDRYQIEITQQPASVGSGESTADGHLGEGVISGFEYGTQLNTLLDNIEVPAGAGLSVIDDEGAYVPLKKLNFDTSYVFVTVNANTYFDVLAEDGLTRITYQLQPESSTSTAIVLSNVYEVQQRDLLIQYVPRGTNVQSFLSNLTPSLGATMKVVDKMGNERTDGTVADDDRLIVTSADGAAQTVYYISKLATEYVQQSTYLAYITSNVYTVDQLSYTVFDVSGSATVSDFYSRINVADGATAVVVNEFGEEKTTGDIDGSDMVQVTSADRKIVVNYTFGPLTSASELAKQDITIYPNPTHGRLNISGLEPGGRIQIFNSMGEMMRDIKVKQSIETVSIVEYASGVYFVITSNDNIITGKQKVIKF